VPVWQALTSNPSTTKQILKKKINEQKKGKWSVRGRQHFACLDSLPSGNYVHPPYLFKDSFD
jgi:hypothetical protein